MYAISLRNPLKIIPTVKFILIYLEFRSYKSNRILQKIPEGHFLIFNFLGGCRLRVVILDFSKVTSHETACDSREKKNTYV